MMMKKDGKEEEAGITVGRKGSGRDNRCGKNGFPWTSFPFYATFLVVVASLHSYPTLDLSMYVNVWQPAASWTAAANSTTMTANETEGGEAVVPARYAYVFVIGGCNPNQPTYRNYLYNILIAKEIFRRHGSTADVIMFVQMSNKSNATELPEEDVRLLREMDVLLRYSPKIEEENFYTTVMDKFRILSLTEYRRVLFMDGDVMPMGSLDYLFHMSDTRGVFKENVVVPGSLAPANGGFFMLTPYENAAREINDLLRARTERGNAMGRHPYFDERVGWGHAIRSPDRWETTGDRNGTNWTFYAAYADQGLLYHWVKYHRKSVSILKPRGIVENWGPDSNGAVRLEERLENPYSSFAGDDDDGRGLNLPEHCIERCRMGRPHSDYVHFTGLSKPWLERNGPLKYDVSDGEAARKDSKHYWFWHLHNLNERLGMNLNLSDWMKMETTGRPILGMYPAEEQARNFTGIRFETDPNAAGG